MSATLLLMKVEGRMVSRSEAAAVPVLEETLMGEGEVATAAEDFPHPIKDLQLGSGLGDSDFTKGSSGRTGFDN